MQHDGNQTRRSGLRLDPFSPMAVEPAAASRAEGKTQETQSHLDEAKGVDIFVPERVLEKLEQAKTFAEFRDTRTFRFLHMYSGSKDVLAESLARECQKQQL